MSPLKAVVKAQYNPIKGQDILSKISSLRPDKAWPVSNCTWGREILETLLGIYVSLYAQPVHRGCRSQQATLVSSAQMILGFQSETDPVLVLERIDAHQYITIDSMRLSTTLFRTASSVYTSF